MKVDLEKKRSILPRTLKASGDSRTARHAEAGLEKLTPNRRAILLRREVEGLSYEQISRVLGIPKGT